MRDRERERFSYKAVGKTQTEIYEEVLSDPTTENRRRRKWRAGWSKHWVRIEEQWRVLDIGSGHNAHPRADVLVDFEVGESPHRSGKATRIDKRRRFVIADACSLPFKDKAFDYILTLHIAEHIDNPNLFCEELMRVGKRGYIETPSKLGEKLFGEPVHKYFVYKEGGTLVFERKRNPTGTKWFYGLFYYGRKRVGHSNIIPPNRAVHLFLKVINFVILRLWYLRAIRKWMYTCFEWEHSFNFKVKD